MNDKFKDENRYKPKSLDPKDGYFPPPWSPREFPERTIGWLEFQKAMKEDPKYYCSDFNPMIPIP